jgi:hypothetical protein
MVPTTCVGSPGGCVSFAKRFDDCCDRDGICLDAAVGLRHAETIEACLCKFRCDVLRQLAATLDFFGARLQFGLEAACGGDVF